MQPTRTEAQERDQAGIEVWDDVTDEVRSRDNDMRSSSHMTKAKQRASQLRLGVDVGHTTAFQKKTPIPLLAFQMTSPTSTTATNTAAASDTTNLPTIVEIEMDTPVWLQNPSTDSNPPFTQPHPASEDSTHPQHDGLDYIRQPHVQQTSASNDSVYASSPPNNTFDYSSQPFTHPNDISGYSSLEPTHPDSALDYSSLQSTYLSSASEDSDHPPSHIHNASDDSIHAHQNERSDHSNFPTPYPRFTSDYSTQPTPCLKYSQCPCGDLYCVEKTTTKILEDIPEEASMHTAPEILGDQVCRALPGCKCEVCKMQRAETKQPVPESATQTPFQSTFSTPTRRHSSVSFSRPSRFQPKRSASLDLVQESPDPISSISALPRNPRDRNARPIVHRTDLDKPLPPLPLEHHRFQEAAGDFRTIRSHLERAGINMGGTVVPNRLVDRGRISYLADGTAEEGAGEAFQQGVAGG